MERADFLEQPRLLVARGRLRSPRGEAFATRRRGGGAPGSVRASRIDFSLLRSTLQRAEEAHENSGRPLGRFPEIAATCRPARAFPRGLVDPGARVTKTVKSPR